MRITFDSDEIAMILHALRFTYPEPEGDTKEILEEIRDKLISGGSREQD